MAGTGLPHWHARGRDVDETRYTTCPLCGKATQARPGENAVAACGCTADPDGSEGSWHDLVRTIEEGGGEA